MNKRQRKKKYGPPRRYGLTEKELARLSPEQGERLLELWFPLRRAIFPTTIIISGGIIEVSGKDTICDS